MEFSVREGNQLQVVSDPFVKIKDCHDCHKKHEFDELVEFGVFFEVLHKRSSLVVDKYDIALEPPLVHKHNTVLEIGFKFAVWLDRLIRSINEGIRQPHQVD